MFLNLRQNIKQKDSKNYTHMTQTWECGPPIICATINRRDYCESRISFRRRGGTLYAVSCPPYIQDLRTRVFFFSFKYQKFAPPTLFIQTIHSTSGRLNIRYDFFPIWKRYEKQEVKIGPLLMFIRISGFGNRISEILDTEYTF